MTLLLMAAGKGSRYGKLKQFDGLGPKEEFLMEYSIYDGIENGFDHVVVITQKDNVAYLSSYLKERLPAKISLDVIAQELSDLPPGCSFTGEREKPWGTAHAVWTARNVITKPFAVINADDYYGKDAYKKAAKFIGNDKYKDAYGLIAYTLRDTLSPYGSVSRGVCKRDGNTLVSVEERTRIEQQKGKIKDLDTGLEFSGEELVSMNFWICRPSIFGMIEQDLRHFLETSEDPSRGEVYLPFVIQNMLRKKKIAVVVIPSDSMWFGVTYSDDKEMAVTLLKQMSDREAYPSPLWPMKNF